MKGSRQEFVGSPDRQIPYQIISAAASHNVAEDANEREIKYSDQELKQALGRFAIHGPDYHMLAEESRKSIADRCANVYFGAYQDKRGNQQQLRGIVDTWHQDESSQGIGSFWQSVADPRHLNRHREFDRGELSFVSRLGATVVRIVVQRYDYNNREVAMYDEEYDENGKLAPVKDNVTISPLGINDSNYADYIKRFRDEDERLAEAEAEDRKDRERLMARREAVRLAQEAYKDNNLGDLLNGNASDASSNDDYELT